MIYNLSSFIKTKLFMPTRETFFESLINFKITSLHCKILSPRMKDIVSDLC